MIGLVCQVTSLLAAVDKGLPTHENTAPALHYIVYVYRI